MSNIITEVSTMDAITLGKIEGLKSAHKDARHHLPEGIEKDFFLKYLEVQIKNLEQGFKEKQITVRRL